TPTRVTRTSGSTFWPAPGTSGWRSTASPSPTPASPAFSSKPACRPATTCPSPTCGWTCSGRRTPRPTARTRGPPATGRWTPGGPSTATSCGCTVTRCRRARRSRGWPASTTRRSTSPSTGSGRSARARPSADGLRAAVGVLDPGQRRAAPGGDRPGGGFRFPHHPQDVAAGQPRAVLFAPAPLQQFRDERRIARHIGEAVGEVLGAVEIPADPDVIYPRHLAHVLGVVGDLGQRCPRRGVAARVLRPRLPAGLVPGFQPAPLHLGVEPQVPLPALLGDEGGHERDHADALVARQPGEHLVRHVARMIAQRP